MNRTLLRICRVLSRRNRGLSWIHRTLLRIHSACGCKGLCCAHDIWALDHMGKKEVMMYELMPWCHVHKKFVWEVIMTICYHLSLTYISSPLPLSLTQTSRANLSAKESYVSAKEPCTISSLSHTIISYSATVPIKKRARWWCVRGDKWWVMDHESWVMDHESWVMSMRWCVCERW